MLCVTLFYSYRLKNYNFEVSKNKKALNAMASQGFSLTKIY